MSSVLVIAEAGVNHNGDLELAMKLVDSAANAGADFVKFQTFKSEKLATKKAKKAKYQQENQPIEKEISQLEMLSKLELSSEDHLILNEYCEEKNIQFLSTAFDLESVDLLSGLRIPFFKIPSGEITNLPYLKKIGRTKKPIILSTGMANIDEVAQALQVLLKAGTKKEEITVLHCNSAYPTPFEDVNLKAMLSMQKKFDVKVGYSDHTLGIEVAIGAVALGASVIEKHLTINRQLPGPDHASSLEPEEFSHMVRAIRNIEQSLGNGEKKPSASEVENIKFVRKSICLARNMSAGEYIDEDDLIMKRPGEGISPMKTDMILGKKLVRDVSKDEAIGWNDFK